MPAGYEAEPERIKENGQERRITGIDIEGN